MKQLSLVGRVLFSLVFLAAAPGHFQSGTIAYAAAQGVPLASLAVPASGVLALLGALSVALGYRTRWGAAALVAFLVPVTFSLHAFWKVGDPMMHQLQLVMFMKNLALIGGALTFVVHGAGAYSLDARAEARRGAPVRRTVGVAA
jgi:putative oxidoreductase